MAVTSELLELMARWVVQVQDLRAHFDGLRDGLYAAEAAAPFEGIVDAADRGRGQLPVNPLQRGMSKEWY